MIGFRESWLKDRERWLLWTPVFLGAGAAAYLTAGQEPWPWIGGAVGLSAVIPSLFLRGRDETFAATLAAIALFALGFQLAAYRSESVAGPVLEHRTGAVEVIGILRDLENRGARARLTIAVEGIEGWFGTSVPDTVRVTIADRSVGDIAVGDRMAVRAVLRPPGRATHPHGFDFRRWAWFKQLGATGYAIGTPQVLGISEELSLQTGLHAVRRSIAARIRAAVPGEAGDVAVAVITGDRGGVSEDTLNAMRDSGLAHLLAISGLHLGLVAATIFFLVRMLCALSESLALYHPIKKWAAGAALLGSFAYLLISGGTVPTVRAFIMTGLVLLAVMFDRQAISMRLVAVAATVVLLLRPESVIGPGFQMSFAAVVALVAVYETYGKRFHGAFEGLGHAAGPVRYAAGVLLTTLIATCATLPFVWHHFGRIATLGILSNLLAVPLMAFLIMPMALIGVVAMPFGLEGPFLGIMGWGIEQVLWIARMVAAWDAAHASFPTLSGTAVATIAFGGLWLALWREHWRIFGIAFVLLGVLLFPLRQMPDILISESGRLVAVRQQNGDFSFSTTRKESFVRDSWSGSFGIENVAAGAPSWPGPAGRCDSLGCTVTRNGTIVAITWDPRSLAADCRRADVLIAGFPVRRQACTGPERVIDFFALRRGGAHSVALEQDGLRVDMVDPPGRSRPWAPDPWEDVPWAVPDQPDYWED
ncbi:ComEC family competence protein [Hwanghaeella grinnelliae]|uniref:ComEC family competence protein n=1 Tax=Hwanghaeella grinnelliae TaxID=2500179 RepID=A0A3S2ZAK4_9PROT|nr:ComEC/Rec2 family competence protein [Hwanghaeella grinnelliae]RVU39334.1 ComEC family competence protein [Hwanghaeella grinnelliae]